ncbi:MAG: alanine--tRNA ligase [Candidatus Aenigmarchaeota archaeon]|nr:alanine--tRNA ligase [Candidatus Aenigmarchaeota archaeon]
MLTDKEAKKKYRSEFYNNPDKYYATAVLKKEGFIRNICSKCGKPFWNMDEKRKVCGDPACGEVPFSFIGKTPAKRLNYIEVWKKFSSMFKKFGYTPIKRYPIVARWNPTMEYTNASIAAFQPFVISGEAEPPAKKLVIPQLCFRTVDIDNVGITGSHNTVFCMIGQHMFVQPKEWNQNLAFEHIQSWLKKGLGLPNEEITFHEDAWAGGGNLGPCMEFFSRGCELGNQVYMMYEQTNEIDASGVSQSGIKGLDLKVLDMGMGQERNAWFSQGVNTVYDATFPTVIKHLLKITGVKPDKKLLGKYVPYAGLLNLDEVEDINKAWSEVGKKVGCDANELKESIMTMAGLYSIAEHSRALLIMFNDGALPSNMGDSYNLRIILRRMLSFIDKYHWNVDVHKLFELHAKYLKPQYPELTKNLENVEKIFDIEKEKYAKTRDRSIQIISKIVKQNIGTEDLLQLYDSQGIQPELIAQEAKKLGKNISVPDNFYALVSDLHEKQEQKHATKKTTDINLDGAPATQALYFDNYKRRQNTAKVLRIVDKYVVLDKTVAYPTSGGQMHDTGTIDRQKFTDVFKQGQIIVHYMADTPEFKQGQEVKVEIDLKRRMQLAKHHTATHIINEAARQVLGDHVNQSSAFKDVDKAHLDITHYAAITEEELNKIEKVANSIVKRSIKINKNFFNRSEAEKKYGVRIYQGGAVPGKELRIVKIGTDVEACGGTHLDSTKEVGEIIIVSSEHIQDNISRITFVAGEAAKRYMEKENEIIERSSKLLNVNKEKLVPAVKNLVGKWKRLKKEIDKKSQQKATGIIEDLEKQFVNNVLIAQIETDMKTLQSVSKQLSSDERVIILFGVSDKIYVFVSCGQSTDKNAGQLVKNTCEKLGGKGGGTKNLGQGVAFNKQNLEKVMKELEEELF